MVCAYLAATIRYDVPGAIAEAHTGAQGHGATDRRQVEHDCPLSLGEFVPIVGVKEYATIIIKDVDGKNAFIPINLPETW